MFEDIAKTYGFDSEEEDLYFEIVMRDMLGVFSPFEIDRDVDFPKKDELGGVVLKFIGGGAAYFKLQKEMPSVDEVKSICDVCKFLKESFGEYVVARIMCQPNIEIKDIDISDFDDIDVCFVSVRLNDGDKILEDLSEKLKTKKGFSPTDHILRLMLPFLGRRDNEKFILNYCEFISLLMECKKELPDQYRLSKDAFSSLNNDSNKKPIKVKCIF